MSSAPDSSSPRSRCPTVALVVIGCLLAVLLLGMTLPVFGDVTPAETTSDRSLTSSVAAPNGTVQITTEVSLDSAQNVSLLEEIDPGFEAIELVDTDGATDVSVNETNSTIEANFTNRDEIAFTYRLTVSGNASIGDIVSINGTLSGEVAHEIGVDEIEVVDDPGVAVWLSEVPAEQVAGESTTVEATVEHLNDSAVTTDVTFRVDGDEVYTETVSLGAFEQDNVSFEWTPASGDIGTVSMRVDTATHNDSASIEVHEPATFAVSDLDAPATVTQYESFTPTVEVENTGDVSGTQTITLSLVDGDELMSESISLDAGEATIVSFDDVALETPGVHELVVESEDDSADRPIVVEAAPAEITFEDQLLGTTSGGDPAMYVSDLVAEAGWTVVLVDGTNNSVVGMETLEETHNGGEAIVPVTAPDDAGMDIEAVVVPDSDGIAVGEAMPGDVDRLAEADGVAFEGSITTSSLRYEDATGNVYIDAASLVGGDASTDIPFIVGVHRMVDGERELLGYESMVQGTHEDLSIGLDEELGVGEYELVAKLHAISVGGPGQAYRQVADGEISESGETISVTIEETPQFVIDSIDHDETVSPGGTLSIAVTVHNEGTVGGTQSIWVSMGQRVVTEDVHLEANESDTVSLSLPIPGDALGTYSVDVEVDDSATSFDITVQESSTESDSIPGFTPVVVLVTLVFAALVGWRRR